MNGKSERAKDTTPGDRRRGADSEYPAGERRILIIDDDTKFVRDLLDLWKPSFTVSMASTGREAMEKLDRGAPALVIIDIDLPCYLADTDSEEGFHIIEAVKSRWPHLPVIAATGHADARERALCAGAHHFLIKPFSIAELADIVERLLGAHRAQEAKGGSRMESQGE